MTGFTNRKNNRGITIIIFVVLIMIIVGFMMIQKMTTAMRKSRLTMKLFNSNYAMNLAESSIAAATNIVREKMNRESGNNGDFYLEFRLDRDNLKGISPIDLSNEPIIKKIAKEFDGKILKLEVKFKGVDVIKNNQNQNVSLDNVEKCGVVEFVCNAQYKDAKVEVITRQDFKVVIMKNHLLNSYVLMVRDAWDEYLHKPSTKYANWNYCQKPGSYECYNPKDHYLKVTSIDNIFYGKIYFGGSGLDPGNKIILNLCDDDYDLMEPLPELKPGVRLPNNKKLTVNDCYYNSSKSKNLEKKEAEKVFYSIFQKTIFTPPNTPFSPNSTISLSVENLGYRSYYKAPKYKSDYIPTNTAQILNYIKTPSKWNKIKFIFGVPSYFYELGTQTLASQFGYDKSLWIPHRDKRKAGLDLWGDRKLRVPTPIEGNVYARYTTLGYLKWTLKQGSKIYKLFVQFPGFLDLVPLNDPRILPDRGAWFTFWKMMNVGGITAYNLDTNSPHLPPRETVRNSAGTMERNFDSSIHLCPYNYLIKNLIKNRPADFKKFPDFSASSPNFSFTNLLDIEPFVDDLLIMNKCTAIYDSAKEFFEDRLTKNNKLYIDGRIIVMGDVPFNGNYSYEGTGMIISVPNMATKQSGSFIINGNIIKSTDRSSLTLYSPYGKIKIPAVNIEIDAALFALNAGFKNGKISSQNFIIGPSRSSLKVGKWIINGSICADRLNLPSFPTEVEVVYDPMLIPSSTAADRHRDYHVSLSRKYNYWYRHSI